MGKGGIGMGKDDFSDGRHTREKGSQKQREEFETIQQKSAEDGSEMNKIRLVSRKKNDQEAKHTEWMLCFFYGFFYC